MSKLAHSNDATMLEIERNSRLVIRHVRPPIPTTAFDWCAFYEGEEENGHYGWGATRQEAINDLETRYEEAS